MFSQDIGYGSNQEPSLYRYYQGGETKGMREFTLLYTQIQYFSEDTRNNKIQNFFEEWIAQREINSVKTLPNSKQLLAWHKKTVNVCKEYIGITDEIREAGEGWDSLYNPIRHMFPAFHKCGNNWSFQDLEKIFLGGLFRYYVEAVCGININVNYLDTKPKYIEMFPVSSGDYSTLCHRALQKKIDKLCYNTRKDDIEFVVKFHGFMIDGLSLNPHLSRLGALFQREKVVQEKMSKKKAINKHDLWSHDKMLEDIQVAIFRWMKGASEYACELCNKAGNLEQEKEKTVELFKKFVPEFMKNNERYSIFLREGPEVEETNENKEDDNHDPVEATNLDDDEESGNHNLVEANPSEGKESNHHDPVEEPSPADNEESDDFDIDEDEKNDDYDLEKSSLMKEKANDDQNLEVPESEKEAQEQEQEEQSQSIQKTSSSFFARQFDAKHRIGRLAFRLSMSVMVTGGLFSLPFITCAVLSYMIENKIDHKIYRRAYQRMK